MRKWDMGIWGYIEKKGEGGKGMQENEHDTERKKERRKCKRCENWKK